MTCQTPLHVSRGYAVAYPINCVLGVQRGPHPVGRPLKALDGLLCMEVAVLDITPHGVQRLELSLADGHVAEERG
jgi:hypothetical protein